MNERAQSAAARWLPAIVILVSAALAVGAASTRLDQKLDTSRFVADSIYAAGAASTEGNTTATELAAIRAELVSVNAQLRALRCRGRPAYECQ